MENALGGDEHKKMEYKLNSVVKFFGMSN